jgi:hypothetical protein
VRGPSRTQSLRNDTFLITRHHCCIERCAQSGEPLQKGKSVNMSFNVALAARDNTRVNIYDIDDVIHWCEKFGCTKPELWDAVTAVGTSAVAVRQYISTSKDNARTEATERHLTAVRRLLQSSR